MGERQIYNIYTFSAREVQAGKTPALGVIGAACKRLLRLPLRERDRERERRYLALRTLIMTVFKPDTWLLHSIGRAHVY
jgi:hypothetical protein